MTVGVLDSGVDPAWVLSGQLDLRAFAAFHFVFRDGQGMVEVRESDAERTAGWLLHPRQAADCFDLSGHGTKVCALITQACPSVQLVVAQVLDGTGQGNEAAALAGLDWLIDQHPAIINLSLGLETPLAQTEWRRLFDRAQAAGIVIVCAAAVKGWPAFEPGLQTVADSQLADWSEFPADLKSLLSGIVDERTLVEYCGSSATAWAAAVWSGQLAQARLRAPPAAFRAEKAENSSLD